MMRDPWFLAYGGPGHIVFSTRGGGDDEGNHADAAGAPGNAGRQRGELSEPAELELGSTVVVRYPEVEVELVGQDGNAFNIMGKVRNALSAAGVPKQEVDEYLAESMSGDYDHLIQTAMRWVTVV